jgi:hypothetical protein
MYVWKMLFHNCGIAENFRRAYTKDCFGTAVDVSTLECLAYVHFEDATWDSFIRARLSLSFAGPTWIFWTMPPKSPLQALLAIANLAAQDVSETYRGNVQNEAQSDNPEVEGAAVQRSPAIVQIYFLAASKRVAEHRISTGREGQPPTTQPPMTRGRIDKDGRIVEAVVPISGQRDDGSIGSLSDGESAVPQHQHTTRAARYQRLTETCPTSDTTWQPS